MTLFLLCNLVSCGGGGASETGAVGAAANASNVGTGNSITLDKTSVQLIFDGVGGGSNQEFQSVKDTKLLGPTFAAATKPFSQIVYTEVSGLPILITSGGEVFDAVRGILLFDLHLDASKYFGNIVAALRDGTAVFFRSSTTINSILARYALSYQPSASGRNSFLGVVSHLIGTPGDGGMAIALDVDDSRIYTTNGSSFDSKNLSAVKTNRLAVSGDVVYKRGPSGRIYFVTKGVVTSPSQMMELS